MATLLNARQKRDLTQRGFSRRHFGRIAAMLGAGATALPFYNEPALAQLSAVSGADSRPMPSASTPTRIP